MLITNLISPNDLDDLLGRRRGGGLYGYQCPFRKHYVANSFSPRFDNVLWQIFCPMLAKALNAIMEQFRRHQA